MKVLSRFILLATIGAGVLLLTGVVGIGPENVLTRIQELGPIPFSIVMTLLLLTGFPLSPLSVLAGVLYGPLTGLILTGIVLLVDLALAYAIAVYAAGDLIRRLLERYNRRPIPEMKERAAWMFTFIVRVTPGLTVGMKNYILGAARTPVVPYFVVSWIMSMVYVVALVLLGDSVMELNWTGIILATAMLLVLALITAAVRYRLKKNRTVGEIS